MNAKHKIMAFLLISITGIFSLNSLNSEINPLMRPNSQAADEYAIIYCPFENNNLDELGHSVETNGTWSYNSSHAINGDYSIEQYEDGRNHQKWAYSTDMAQGTIECFFIPTNLTFDPLSSYHILGADNGLVNLLQVYATNEGYLKAMHTSNIGSEMTISSSTVIEEHVLYHIAYTWGPRGQELWINGVLENSTASTAELSSDATYFGIGNTYEIVSSKSAQGLWDEFRLSNIQRTVFPEVLDIIGPKLATPQLNEFDSPDEDGNFNVHWFPVEGATNYTVYRSNDYITEINESLTVVNTTDLEGTKEIYLDSGTYYYVVVATNASGMSYPSNCQRQTVAPIADLIDANTIICSPLNSQNYDIMGHSVETHGTWSYNSWDAIDGWRSIEQYADDRNHQKWAYTANMSQGTIESFFLNADFDFADGTSRHILGGDDGFDNTLQVYHTNDGTIKAMHVSNSGLEITLHSSTQIEENVWYHIAYSWGPRGQELWINGELENSTASTAELDNDTAHYGIGKTGEIGSSLSAKGLWDDFRLSNIQRSEFSYINAFIGDRPSTPVLNPIDSPDIDGNISLSWNSVEGATHYKLFRSNEEIVEVNETLLMPDLEIEEIEINETQPLVNVTSLTFSADNDVVEGTYFYVVVAINASGFSYLSNCESVVVLPTTLPEEFTNGIWQDLFEGINAIECIDESGIWMTATVECSGPTEIRLTYFETNPTDDNGLEGISLAHFYQIQVEDVEQIEFVSVTFYFGEPDISNGDLDEMCMYKYNSSSWSESEYEQRKESNSIYMNDIEVNCYYALGNDLTPSNGSEEGGIPGYNFNIFVVFTLFAMVLTMYIKKKR